jgi:hypothetical protein
LSIDLVEATSNENTQLVNKVKELELEVTLWKKQALSSPNGASDREDKLMGQKNVALCVIDGTRSVFSTNYITEGEEGGRKAGQEIIRGIANHLADASSFQDSTVKVSVAIYIMKARLRRDLAANDMCAPEQFDKFFVGLDETPYLNTIEVSSKRDADKKIKGEQTLQVDSNSSNVLTQNTCNFSPVFLRPFAFSLVVCPTILWLMLI